MYPLVVLSLIAVALLIAGRSRERLQPTTTIKAPPHDQAEKDRIWNAMPASVKTVAEAMASAPGGPAGQTAKDVVADIVSSYYTVYAAATSPITEENILSFVNTIAATDTEENKSAIREILKLYYINQSVATTTDGVTGTTTTGGAAATGAAATGATGAAATGATGGAASPNSADTPQAPAAGMYSQLKTQFEAKQKQYNDLLRSVATATDPPTADIERLRALNRELASLIEQIIQTLKTSQSAEMERISRELSDTLGWIERHYGVLSADSDKAETLRRIREFEEVRADSSVSLYMIILIGLAVALLVTMIFSQRVSATTAMPPASPASTANLM